MTLMITIDQMIGEDIRTDNWANNKIFNILKPVLRAYNK